MMAVLDKEVPGAVQRKLSHIIVVDQAFEVFTRIWVMAEIAKGQELELNQVAMLFPAPERLQKAAARRSVVPASAAAEVARVRETLDIRKCKASRQEDVDAILASIPDAEKFNEQLKAVLFNERSGILETWSAERCAGFFDVIDPLKELVEREHWSAPQVIMLGQESTGKSTLLERLTGLPIFPRNADLCTRSLIKVCLRRGPARKLRLLVQDILSLRFDDEDGREVELDELGAAVMKEMTRQVRLESLRQEMPDKSSDFYDATVSDAPLQPSDGLCTKKVLVIELSSPKAPNLDVVDCPGLVAASARGRPTDVAQETAALVRTFAKKHRDSALFVVAVKASEQPNNSLAMRLVQELKLESRALGVLTMTDVLTGDLTDGETTLHATFLKHHGPRLLQLLQGASDAGGGVPLALGYTLTALNDVCEDKGWLNLSRVDAMAQWEVRYFKQLAAQWAIANSKESHTPEAELSQLLLQRTTCNSLWRHIKDAVDKFVRDNWLNDTIKLVREQEALTVTREQSLGLPRAMAPHHIAELCFQTDLLPASLRAVASFEDGSVEGQGDQGGQGGQGGQGDKHKYGHRGLSSPMIADIFSKRFQVILAGVIANPWQSGGFIHNLVTRLEHQMLSVLPEAVALGPPGSRTLDWQKQLDACFRKVEHEMLHAVQDLKQHVQSRLDAALQADATPERIGRMKLAIASLQANLWQEMNMHECVPGEAVFTTFPLKGIREALGIVNQLEACPFARVERLASAFSFSLKLDTKQIAWRCSLHFHRFLEDFFTGLPVRVDDICKKLSEDQWVEDCTDERLQLLRHLQNLRLAQARLKDAFGEHFEEAVHSVEIVNQDGLAESTQSTRKTSEESVQFVRRVRSEEEVATTVSAWKEALHERAMDFFSSVESLDSVLHQIAENTDADTDFREGDADVLWHGECSDVSEAFLWIEREDAPAMQTYVNRVLAALFVDDESFARLSSLPKEPFRMTCGNQRCINLMHLCVP